MLLGSLSALAAGAQAPGGQVALTELEVDVWPEYDRAAVLIIYRATIAPGSLPAVVSFRIPAAAGEPNALAEQDSTGRLVNVAYRREVEGEWADVIFTASRPAVQLEYYDPSLEREGSRRRYTFTWAGDYTVSSLSIQVQQPLGARDMQVVPEPTSRGPGPNGLTYHTISVAGLAAGQSRAVAIEYTKDTEALSAESLAPSSQTPPTATGRAPGTGGLPTAWIIGGSALLLAGAGAALAWHLTRDSRATRSTSSSGTAPASPARRRAGRRGGAHAGTGGPGDAHRGVREDPPPNGEASRPDASSEPVAFCTQCGAAADEDDRFCRACGSRLRGR